MNRQLNNEKYYTVAAAAQILNVSRTIILNAIHKKELKAVKIGQRGKTSAWRIKESDFIEYCHNMGITLDVSNL